MAATPKEGRPDTRWSQSMGERRSMRVFISSLFLVFALPVFVESRDLFLIARCDYRCHQEGKACKEKCYGSPPEKPGKCGDENYPFYKNCVHECNSYKDCPNMDLCCTHSCGKTCQMPIDLNAVSGLPEIPINVTISKSPDLSCMLVDWNHSGESLFIVETKEDSGPWQIAHKTPRLSHPMKIPIQSGVEYVARVAAVNSLGSKGYSGPSNSFRINFEAKPPEMPENLIFKGALKNGSVSGLLSWQLPHADHQISRYLVIWSQRIADENTPPHKGSKEVHRKTIPHGKSCVRIKNLKLNAQYTFHVQAQVIHEKTKISSKRATLNLDTSTYTSSNHGFLKAGSKKKSKQKLTARYSILRTNQGLSAEISWKSRKKTKYGITWESVCDKKKSTVVITSSPHVIPSLVSNCQYIITIREINECKKGKKVQLTFKTD